MMFGGLHFEMGALKLLGNLLEDSGWTEPKLGLLLVEQPTHFSKHRMLHVHAGLIKLPLVACICF